LSGTSFRVTNTTPYRFYRIGATGMSSNDLLTANVLNRLAYGPTPDELERVRAIGPQAYIDEQLAPQNIPNTYDSYTVVHTNGVTLPPSSNWTTLSVTGFVSSSTFYMYLRAPGDVY